MKRLGVLHRPGGSAGLHEIFLAAHGLCDIVLLLREPVARERPEVVAAARRMFEVKIVDGEIEPAGLDGLTTFHDAELDLVDAVLHKAGLPGAASVTGPWDKLTQRGLLREHGLSAIDPAAVDSMASLNAAIARIGLPGVLKPRRGVSGGGMAFLDTPDDARHQAEHRLAWAGLVYEAAIPTGAHPSGVPWLGDFVSVETVSGAHGRAHVAVFDKLPVAVRRRAGAHGGDAVFVTGDLIPSRIPADVADLVRSKVSQALSALGIRHRVTHTELRILPGDAEIIEINGRVGGHLSRLLRMVGGDDLVRAALTVALGQEWAPVTRPRDGCAAGVFPAFRDLSGPVRSTVTRADLRRIPGVVGVDEVAASGRPRAESGHRAVNVTLRAAHLTELDRLVPRALRTVARLYGADGLADDPWLHGLSLDDVLRDSAPARSPKNDA